MNFLFGIPQWAVSIAVEDEQGTLAGVVYDPMRDELLGRRARRAADARRRADRRLERAASWRPRWSARASATTPRCARAQAAIVARLLPEVRDIRRFGAAAIDLAWTAGGRFDAYYERGLKPGTSPPAR